MRFYRALLHLYPASFRREYGEEMSAVFRRQREAASHAAVPALWFRTILEMFANAAGAHLDSLRQDLRYTARTVTRAPGFALTTMVVIALGIGATTAVFSITDHVLIRSLPYSEPRRLVRLWESPPGYSQTEPSPANYRDWKTMSTSFEAMGAYRKRASNLTGTGEPRRVEYAQLTSDILPILGVQPALGRPFTAEDDREGIAPTAILSHGLWRGHFGGDADVIGKAISLDGLPHEIIGVMPAGFNFPNSTTLLWTPTMLNAEEYQDRGNHELYVIARLKAEVPLAQARAEMAAIATRLEREHPVDNKETAIGVNLVKDEVSSQARLMLSVLLAASLCLLLIACTNVANLFLARALARRRELAVRSALGAGRERLVRQLLTESTSLALCGGVLGIAVAAVALPLLARLVPSGLPIAESPSLDLRVLAFAGALTVATGILFGLVPALKVGRDPGATGLHEGARAGGGRKERLRSALVVAEISASIVLLVCAGLLLRALWRVQAIEPGFRTENVLTLRTALPLPRYAAVGERQRFYSQVLSEVGSLPGVTGSAYISGLPMVMTGGIWGVSVDGVPTDISGNSSASLRYVTPRFFSTLGIPFEQGRDVSDTDTQKAPFVAVVSASMVKRYWPDQDPIGQRFQFAFSERTVVGVVGDIRVRGLEQDSEPQVYIPFQQVEDNRILGYTPKDLVIRASTDPKRLVPEVRRIIQEADPQQPVSNVQLLEEIVDGETDSRQTQLRVIACFALIAFVLAGIGIHGLLAYAVSQRTQEFGVRIALGAQRSDIMQLVVRDGVVLALAGVVIGVAVAYAAGRGMESLLFGVRPGDAATFLSVVGLAVVMTIVGSLIPALRAMRLDPATTIRTE